MALVSPSQSSPGDEITSASINDPVNQLAAVVNGNIDQTNIAADGVGTTNIVNSGVTEAKLTHRPSEYIFDHVASGCVITGDAYGSTLKWSMTAGVVYVAGIRVVVNALSAQDVVASKDTYIDVNSSGTVTFTGGNSVANNSASPSLAASSIRLGIVVSGANIASVASVNQGQESKVLPIVASIPYAVTDSLGNLICPRDLNRKILGYRQILADVTNTSATPTQVLGLTCPVIIPVGRKVKVTAYSYALKQSSGSNEAGYSIWEGVVNAGTQLEKAGVVSTGAGTTYVPATVTKVYTPTSTSLTFNAGSTASAGTTTISATATAAAYIQVELA